MEKNIKNDANNIKKQKEDIINKYGEIAERVLEIYNKNDSKKQEESIEENER